MKRFLSGMAAAAVTLTAGAEALAGPPAKGGNGGGSPGGHVVSKSPGNYKAPGNSKPSGNWQPSGSKVSTPSHAPVKDYHLTHGKPFGTGYCYPGKYHDHWTYSCYWAKYGCTCYWCPYTSCYYYWYEPAGCYYPISYVAYAPPIVVPAPAPALPPAPAPVQAQSQAQVQVQVQAQAQSQSEGVPAPTLPVGLTQGIPPLPQ